MTDYLTEGQEVRVKVLEIDNRGRVKLSIKEAILEEGSRSADVDDKEKEDADSSIP